MTYHTSSAGETQQIAFDLAVKLKDRDCTILLYGDLGAGKTTFTQGFARGLGIEQKVLSPTFLVMRQYQIPNSERGFYHIDLYRFDEGFDAKTLGLHELFEGHNIVLIEWPEKLTQLPQKAITIKLNKISETEREIVIDQTMQQ